MGPFIVKRGQLAHEAEVERIVAIISNLRLRHALPIEVREQLHSAQWVSDDTALLCLTCGFRTQTYPRSEGGWRAARIESRRHRAEMAIQDGLEI